MVLVHFRAKNIFLENLALSRKPSCGFLAPCINLEKANDTISRKRPDRCVVVLSVTATAFTGWLRHPMSQVTRFAELLFQDKGFFISIDQVWVSYCSHLFFFTFGLFNLRDFVFGLIKGLCFDPVTRLT